MVNFRQRDREPETGTYDVGYLSPVPSLNTPGVEYENLGPRISPEDLSHDSNTACYTEISNEMSMHDERAQDNGYMNSVTADTSAPEPDENNLYSRESSIYTGPDMSESHMEIYQGQDSDIKDSPEYEEVGNTKYQNDAFAASST